MHSPVLCNIKAGQNCSWTKHFMKSREGYHRSRFQLLPLQPLSPRIYGQRVLFLHSKSRGMTHGELHKSLSYRKTSRLFYCKPLYKVFISLGCSEILGTVGNTILQKKEIAKEKKILQIQCFPKEILYLGFISILLGEMTPLFKIQHWNLSKYGTRMPTLLIWVIILFSNLSNRVSGQPLSSITLEWISFSLFLLGSLYFVSKARQDQLRTCPTIA